MEPQSEQKRKEIVAVLNEQALQGILSLGQTAL